MTYAPWGAALLLMMGTPPALAGPGTWTQLGPEGRPALTFEGGGWVGRIVVDPHDSALVYAAGNEGFFRSADAGNTWSFESLNDFPGGVPSVIVPDPVDAGTVFLAADVLPGLHKSIDGGDTFAPTSLTAYTLWVAFDPTTPDRMYAVTSTGVVVSENHGETWAGSSPGPEFTPAGPALAVDPGTPGTVWAARGGGLQKSENAGQTWEPTGWTQSFLAVHAAEGSPTTLYLVTERDFSLPGSDVRRSVDDGDTWEPAGPGADVHVLVVDPNTPTTLLAVGTATEGEVKESYLHRSLDGGTSWQPPVPIGAVVNDLAIDPMSSSTLYAATANSAVVKSTDGGASWSRLGLEWGELFAYAIAVEPGPPSTLYVGTDSGFFRSANGGESWAKTGELTGRVSLLAVDPTTPSRLFASVYSSIFFIAEQLFRSDDGGASWSEPLLTATPGNRPPGTGHFNSIVLDPSEAGVVYVADARFAGLHRSADAGETWPEIIVFPPDPGPAPGAVRAIALDPDDGAVYVASANGIFRSVDGAAHWTPLGLSNTVAVAIDPSDHAVLYAGTSSGELFRSADRGATWASLGSPASGRTISELLVDTSVPDRVFAATDRGVLATGDAGATWVDLGPPRMIHALALDPARPNTILAASDETGLIEHEIVPCDADQRCDDGDACTADLCRPGAAGQDLIGCTHTGVAIDLANVSCLFATPLGESVCEPGATLDRVSTRLQRAQDLLLRAAQRQAPRRARLVRRARRTVAALARRLARKQPPSDVTAACRDALVGSLRDLRLAIGGLG